MSEPLTPEEEAELRAMLLTDRLSLLKYATTVRGMIRRLLATLDAARAAQDVAGRETTTRNDWGVRGTGAYEQRTQPVTPPPDALRTLIAELLARPEDELAGTAHEIAIRIDAAVAGHYETPPEGMVATGTSWHDGAHTGCDLDYKHRHAIWQPVTPPPDAPDAESFFAAQRPHIPGATVADLTAYEMAIQRLRIAYGIHTGTVKPCPVVSSVTDQPCTLYEGHPQDSPDRFHRYAAPSEGA